MNTETDMYTLSLETLPTRPRRRLNRVDWLAPLRAMTLVEVMAVVVILGLLAGTLMVGFSGAFGKAKHELAKSGIGVLVEKVELYRLDTSQWPGNDNGLAILSDGQATPAQAYYVGPDKLLDPWGNLYLFITPGPNGHPYEIMTYGADGQSGGEGENADLTSANLRLNETPASGR